MACATTADTRKRVLPPTYFLGALVLAIASRFLVPRWAYASALTLALGAVLIAAGIALNLTSDSTFKRHGTPVNPDAEPAMLVTTGAFRVTRNPMYLGMVFIVAGAALLAGAPLGLFSAFALMWALNRFFIPREERNLSRAFGPQYDEYRVAVPRWI